MTPNSKKPNERFPRAADEQSEPRVGAVRIARTQARFESFAATASTPSTPICSVTMLRSVFGSAAVDSAARSLGLDALSEELALDDARKVNDLCVARRNTLAGLNFLSRLSCSAQRNTPSFQSAAAQAGVDPAVLSAPVLRDIDQRFAAEFESATQHDIECVDVVAARDLMRTAIEAVMEISELAPFQSQATERA